MARSPALPGRGRSAFLKRQPKGMGQKRIVRKAGGFAQASQSSSRTSRTPFKTLTLQAALLSCKVWVLADVQEWRACPSQKLARCRSMSTIGAQNQIGGVENGADDPNDATGKPAPTRPAIVRPRVSGCNAGPPLTKGCASRYACGSTRSCRLASSPGSSRTPCRIPDRQPLRGPRP